MRNLLAHTIGLFTALLALGAVAQVPISQLPNGGLMQQTDTVPVVRSGVTMKTNPYTWPASGTLMLSTGNSAPQGLSPINGQCAVGIAGTWGLADCNAGVALGTAATQNTGTSGANLPFLNGVNTWTGTQDFNGTSAPSHGGFYQLSGDTAISAGGLPVVEFEPTSSAVDFFKFKGAATGAPAYLNLSAVGSDGHIGINYNSVGTTTSGGQYNGLATSTTGEQFFTINGQTALELTDTYWNPNLIYAGPTNGWPVLSSGQGVTNGGPGPDIIGAIYSVGSSIYNSNGSGTANGASVVVAAKGPTGQIHFTSNGYLGGVTISPPTATNPGGWDHYALPNALIFQPGGGGTGAYPAILAAPSGDPADANIGMTFYNYANGPFFFSNGNTNLGAFNIDYVASPNTYLHTGAGPSGQNAYIGSTGPGMNLTTSAANNITLLGGTAGSAAPVIYAGGNAGNIRLQLAGTDLAGVDIANGGQYNGTSSLGLIASFFGGFQPTDHFSFTASDGTGSPPHIDMAPVGTDTNIAVNISGKGTGGGNIKGTGTNDAAPAGYIGEYISSNIPSGSAVALTTATTSNVTSISLGAGDWKVCGNVGFIANVATTATAFSAGVNTTSATLPTPPGGGAYWQLGISVGAAGTEPESPIGCVRESLASTTTIYLAAQSIFAINSMSAFGFIDATRIH